MFTDSNHVVILRITVRLVAMAVVLAGLRHHHFLFREPLLFTFFFLIDVKVFHNVTIVGGMVACVLEKIYLTNRNIVLIIQLDLSIFRRRETGKMFKIINKMCLIVESAF